MFMDESKIRHDMTHFYCSNYAGGLAKVSYSHAKSGTIQETVQDGYDKQRIKKLI